MFSKTTTLNNGVEMPVVGLGTYKSDPHQLEQAIYTAIDAGYRHFDCAWIYGNESEIGNAIKNKIEDGTVKRENLFITGKLWNNFHERDQVVPKLKESLAALQLDYIDLYLVHWPFAFKKEAPTLPVSDVQSAYSDTDYLETWQGMEECVELGLAKSIGVSNFNSKQIERLCEAARIKPAVNQVECNPNFNQKRLIDFCRNRGIAITGYAPLGRSERAGTPGFPEPTIFDPKVIEIAAKYNKTASQVVLNYLVSLGISVIPKSVTGSRILENINILDFELSSEDVVYLDSCNTNSRVCPTLNFADHKDFPFSIDF